MLIRIGHTSDWHLGKSHKGDKKTTRTNVIQAANRFIDSFIENKVDIVLISGDLFDETNPKRYAINQFAYLFKRFQENNIQVIVSKGNHDAPRDSIEEKYNTLITFDEMGYIKYINNEKISLKVNGIDLGIYGVGYEDDIKNLNQNIQKTLQDAPMGANSKNILMIHQSVGGIENSENRPMWLDKTNSLQKNTLANYGFDYIALGHHHNPSKTTIKGIVIAYSGGIEHWDYRNWDQWGKITTHRSWNLIEVGDTLQISQVKVPVSNKLRKKVDLRSKDNSSAIQSVWEELKLANDKVKKGLIRYEFYLPFNESDEGFPFQNYQEYIPDVLIRSSDVIFHSPESVRAKLASKQDEEILDEFIEKQYQNNSEYWISITRKLLGMELDTLDEETLVNKMINLIREGKP